MRHWGRSQHEIAIKVWRNTWKKKKKKFASWESPSTDWSNSFWLGLKNISNQFVTGIHAKPNQSYHILKPCKRRPCHCTWGLNMVWSAALWLMEFAYSKKIILPIHSVVVGCQKLVSLFGIMHALRTVQLCIIVLIPIGEIHRFRFPWNWLAMTLSLRFQHPKHQIQNQLDSLPSSSHLAPHLTLACNEKLQRPCPSQEIMSINMNRETLVGACKLLHKSFHFLRCDFRHWDLWI